MESIVGSNTSVFVGVFSRDYDRILFRDPEDVPSYHGTGNGVAMMANRVSYHFDLHGPSVTTDTGCSASLVALHQACQSIRSGECGRAIVGGVNLILDPGNMISLSKLKYSPSPPHTRSKVLMSLCSFLSDEGRCFAFDSRGSGYGRGEGVACVIVKPLEDAISANDPVRAIIRNTAVNQDGRTPGITMPSRSAQENIMRAAYAKANLNPMDTGYVEAHGTGTVAGEGEEAAAIAAVFGKPRTASAPLIVGSIKTNIGHLESASGLAGLIKTALILEKGLIPPSLNFERAREGVLLEQWNMKVRPL